MLLSCLVESNGSKGAELMPSGARRLTKTSLITSDSGVHNEISSLVRNLMTNRSDAGLKERMDSKEMTRMHLLVYGV